jgi:hypothetical protein
MKTLFARSARKHYWETMYLLQVTDITNHVSVSKEIDEVCCHCLEPFNDKDFFESDGFFFCEDDYYLLCVSRCGKCEEPIKVLEI